MEDLQKWAGQRIGSLLQMDPKDCDPIVENILAYDDPDELKDFLAAFAENAAQFKVTNFVMELFERKSQPSAGMAAATGRGRGGGRGGDSSSRQEPSEPYADERPSRGRGRGGGRGEKQARREKEKEYPKLQMPMMERDAEDKRLIIIDAASGRHNVLTNCMNCGKVIAEDEGWGPCLFCGNPLEMSDAYGARHGDDRGYMESVGRNQEEERFNESFSKAKATKDRLLDYDRNSKKRTKVIDLDTDWTSESVNPWLSTKQREEALAKEKEQERIQREEKRKIHASIDIFGRTVIDTSKQVQEQLEAKHKQQFENWKDDVAQKNKLLSVLEDNQKGMGGSHSQLSGDSQQLYDRLRASLHASGKAFNKENKFSPNQGANSTSDSKKKGARWDASIDDDRVQDEFADVSEQDFKRASESSKLLPVEESPYGDADDTGQCLSMHQPWASLLVYGFKRAEGRMWKTEHRGRLWIHAASKLPEEHEIESLESEYSELYERCGIPMPSLPSKSGGYPTSALLGCIDLEQCWTKEQYEGVLDSNPAMPPEKNDNDFIFWCLRPRRLAVPLKMGGDRQIWRLPQVSMRAAQRGLKPMRWPVPADGQSLLVSPDLPRREGVAQAKGKAASAAERPEPGSSSSKDKHVPARQGPPRLDLWPTEAPTEVLEAVVRDTVDRDVVVLQDGFVHLVGFIPPDLQQRVVDELREPGLSEQGFEAEQFDGIKVSTNVSRMYLGMHWNSHTQKWEKNRSNRDGLPPHDIAKFFLDMYDEAVKRANRELTRGPNKKRKLQPFPEGTAPTLAVANFFKADGSMQIHRDNTESKDSINAGYAVMGICLGDACMFAYSSEAPGGSRAAKEVRLESGDVYLFGGNSRLLWHGVSRVLPRSAPPSLKLLPGRLSLTLRVY
mmetsp:Transcript_17678/g.31446  ORF Transcript_17678/g.31446 Transcript_17678/m.31446 type:complete len:897 (-) Transcript_17678:71-2761(-)